MPKLLGSHSLIVALPGVLVTISRLAEGRLLNSVVSGRRSFHGRSLKIYITRMEMYAYHNSVALYSQLYD